MMLPSGQPLWQNGMPQFMQRAACLLRLASSYRSTNSLKWVSLSDTGFLGGVALVNSKNPVGFPMVYPLIIFFERHLAKG
jgi:hypothetical protein